MSNISSGLAPATTPGTNNVGYLNIPVVEKSTNYTTVLSDSGKCFIHPESDANNRTFTIDSNANVAYPVGTVIVFKNNSANNLTIAITSDTLTLDGTGTTGSRTLAQYGKATAIKETSTSWSIGGVGLTDPTPPVTYATWNPADKSSGMILETGNLVGHSNTTPGEWTIARSTIGKSSGKWYWEQKKDNSSQSAIMLCGILNISAPVGSGQYVGIDTNGWGYWGYNGYKINGSQTAYGSTYTNGDIIGIALDMDNGTLEFFKNGVSQGVMATGLSGTQYAGVSTNDNGYHTVNFGASAFTYTPPLGFNAGLYE